MLLLLFYIKVFVKMAKDETMVGITGLPIPKKKMSPAKQHEFEKKRRANGRRRGEENKRRSANAQRRRRQEETKRRGERKKTREEVGT